MATPPRDEARALALIQRAEEMRRDNPKMLWDAIASELGIPRGTLSSLRCWAKTREVGEQRAAQAIGREVQVDPGPEPSAAESIEELLARKRRHLDRARVAEEHSQLIPVEVRTPGPIGVCIVGDPHLDDDHCDIAQLERDLRAVAGCEGFFAGHLGDLTNNWVGRLAALYAHQTTRFEDGIRLTEWMLGLAPNLFVVGGNHDCWNNGMDLLRWIVRQKQSGPLRAHGARIALRWPGGHEIRIHARHDFPGKSQFSDTHGMKREILWGHRDHILVAGHTHVDEARVEPSIDGAAHWFFRVSGYKVIDEYALANNFRTKRMASSVSLVIDPTRPVPAERVKPFWCVESAADYLRWARSRG